MHFKLERRCTDVPVSASVSRKLDYCRLGSFNDCVLKHHQPLPLLRLCRPSGRPICARELVAVPKNSHSLFSIPGTPGRKEPCQDPLFSMSVHCARRNLPFKSGSTSTVSPKRHHFIGRKPNSKLGLSFRARSRDPMYLRPVFGPEARKPEEANSGLQPCQLNCI